MRRARRVDSNHAEIRDGLRQAGADVTDLSGIGGGIPDLIVEMFGVRAWVDCKAAGGRETAAQLALWRKLPGAVFVAHDLDEALFKMRELSKIGVTL